MKAPPSLGQFVTFGRHDSGTSCSHIEPVRTIFGSIDRASYGLRQYLQGFFNASVGSILSSTRRRTRSSESEKILSIRDCVP